MTDLNNLRVKIYADGADVAGMLRLNADPLIKGMTTNPTLMNKAGIRDYSAFAEEVLQTIREKPISFEVFSDDFPSMRREALKIHRWQENVYVKIPVTNSHGDSSIPLVRELAQEGVKLNVTALLSLSQVEKVVEALHPETASVVSVFAGRIADTGRDPVPIMQESLKMMANLPRAELLWASVREVLNIWQADASGCGIVTVQHDILAKALKLCAMDLEALSLDTVKMFRNDAVSAGFVL
ncbi:transaldolase [Roseimicrobium sp. ORNL1]|uniref:transaldolase n=1 Tax=Roseimicrobium sp. ORNL1 TaxID=2711231 RepID=UPI0013E1B463|nr:transaldolase [Roseimicrobium sp. ORNL1]QIF00133.1 transaldolase [Roseimicrobium sp. ORNL1]